MKYPLLLLSIIALFSACGEQMPSSFEIASPGNKTKISFSLDDQGQPIYWANYAGKAVVDSSFLGISLENGDGLSTNFKVINNNSSSFNETWEQPWGEEQFITNNYNELRISLEETTEQKRKMDIVFRVYDYGFGFRYEFPEQANLSELKVTEEVTEFNMTADHNAWWMPALGPLRYEYLYENTPLSKMRSVHTPVTFETGDGMFISIHEAALENYTSMYIGANGTNLHGELIPDEEGREVKATIQVPGKTPWRTVQLAENAGDLITSYLILNLNEPNKLGDVSWFKPGKYMGIWWEMHINAGTWASGEKHSANTENTKKYIDFASKHGFDGLLVEGWNETWDGDWTQNGDIFNFTKPYPDFDVQAVSDYGKEKGVYLVGHHETAGNVVNYESQLDDAFAFLEKYGMKAVKTGYVDKTAILSNNKFHHGQFYVEHFRRVIETAAKHKVAIVAHEPIKPTGERRTYPNMIAREGARGQEFNAWSEDGGNPPDHQLIMPFTRYLAGPMDFTPGAFDIDIPAKPDNQVNTTLAKQLALYVTIYSPMQMACDVPESYEMYLDAFEFIKEVGVDWETSKVLESKIGDYLTIARKEKGTGNWFVGAITDENPKETSIKLDFLDEGKTYRAKIYKDAEDAHYQSNPEAYEIEEMEVTSADVISANLAASGGLAISIFAQ